MIRATSAALLLFLVTLTGAVAWLAYDVHKLILHLDGVAVRAEGIETKANATLINLDKGTAIWAASAKSQAGAVEDLAIDAHGTLSQANLALTGVSGVAQHVQGTADAATSLLASAQRATDQIPETLETMNQTIASARPLLEASTRSVDHFDALVTSPDLSQALNHFNGVLGNADGISLDFRKIADKETADWLKPVPWWRQPIKKSGQLIDIGAMLARHTP